MNKNHDYILVKDFQFIIDLHEKRIRKPMAPSPKYLDSYLQLVNLLTYQALNK